jgi:hypothetical protein
MVFNFLPRRALEAISDAVELMLAMARSMQLSVPIVSQRLTTRKAARCVALAHGCKVSASKSPPMLDQ